MRRDTYKVRKITLHPAIRRVMFVLSLKESPLMKRLLPIPALVTGLLSLALPAAHANYGFFSNEGSIVMVDRGGPGQISLFLSPVAGDLLGAFTAGSTLQMHGQPTLYVPYGGRFSTELLAGFGSDSPFLPRGELGDVSDLSSLQGLGVDFPLYSFDAIQAGSIGSAAPGESEPSDSITAYPTWFDEYTTASYSIVLAPQLPADEFGILAINDGAKPLAGPVGLLGGAVLNAGPEAYAGPTTSSSAPSLDPILNGGLGGFNPKFVDSTVPEPSSAVLLALSLGALRFIVRKKA